MLDGVLIDCLAVLCVVYFIIIVVYAGISTSFAFIWLFLQPCLYFWYMEMVLCQKYGTDPPLGASVSGYHLRCGSGCAGNPLYPGISGSSHAGKANLDYVIVLGARVKGTYGQQFPEKASGQGHCLCGGESVTPFWCFPAARGRGSRQQTQVMYDYLVYNGVSPRQLLMESDSTSTVENIAYNKIVIEQDRMKDKKEDHPHARKDRLGSLCHCAGQAAGNGSSHQ